MSFRRALRDASPSLESGYKPGLKALAAGHSGRLRTRRGRWTGSIDLDGKFRSSSPDDPRWDYGVGYRTPGGSEHAVWVEVHPASTSEVGHVLAKLRWLKQLLETRAPGLLAMSTAPWGGRSFHWIATGSVAIRPRSPQARALVQEGVASPRSVLELP